MKFVAVGILLILLLAFMGLALLHALDRRADHAEWNRLEVLQPNEPVLFSKEMVAELPEPARRLFAYAIQPGTPLLPVAAIEMTGQFSLGSKDDPRYQPMEARQILAAPEGFVWAMRTTGGMPTMRSRPSDATCPRP